MSKLPTELRARIAGRHHTVTRSELTGAGIADTDVARWLACRVLVELVPGVLCVGDALRRDPFTPRAVAASTIDTSAVCDALTSARVWGLPGVFPTSRPTMIRAADAPEGHVIERDDGARVLSRAATWFGLARTLRPDHFTSWSRGVLGRHVSLPAAHDVVRACGNHRRGPERRAMAILSSQRRWQRPQDVSLERRVRASLRRRGVVGLDGAHTIVLPSGLRVHPTAVDHTLKWGIEVDHQDWHGGRWSSTTTVWVDRQLADAHWKIVRVDAADLSHHFLRAMNDALATYPMERRAA